MSTLTAPRPAPSPPSTLTAAEIVPAPTRRCARPSARHVDGLAATKKMRRNPEQFFDVTIQPILFTAMFAYIFGGAIAGDVKSYLPLMIPGILAQTALTTCMATGVQLREDMDKGVFDRFKSLPIARIAPLAGPMVADLLRYTIAATLTFAGRHRDGLPARRRRRSACRRRSCWPSSPAGAWPGPSPGSAPSPGARRRCRASR